MAILNEKFGFVLRDNSTGLPSSGQLVELKIGASSYTLTEVATSGFYQIASIPTGKYNVWVNSVDSGHTFGIGTGQVAALGNDLDNVAVSTASEFGFQNPSVYKQTLDLDLVTNKAVPLSVAADENKIISVNASGDYVLTAPSATGFTAVFEANSASELEAALGAQIAEKTIITTPSLAGFNYANTKTISVFGVNTFYGSDIDFSCQSGIVVDFDNDVTDTSTPEMRFFNNLISFGFDSKFVGEIQPIVKIRNLLITDAQIDDTGAEVFYYEKQTGLNVTGTKVISLNVWDNTASGGAASDLQTTYNNSTSPEIVTNATLGALSIQRGSALDTDNVLEVQNGVGTNTFEVQGDGQATFSNDILASKVGGTFNLDSSASDFLHIGKSNLDNTISLTNIINTIKFYRLGDEIASYGSLIINRIKL